MRIAGKKSALVAATVIALGTSSTIAPMAQADPDESVTKPQDEPENDRLNEDGTEVDLEKVKKEVDENSDVDLGKIRDEIKALHDRLGQINDVDAPAANNLLGSARESLDKSAGELEKAKVASEEAKKEADAKTENLGSVINGLYSFASHFGTVENIALDAAMKVAPSNTPIADAAEAKKAANLADMAVSDAEKTVDKASDEISENETKVASLNDERARLEASIADKQKVVDDEVKSREERVEQIVQEEQNKLDEKKAEELASEAAAVAATNYTGGEPATSSTQSSASSTPAFAGPSSVDTSSVVSAAMSRIGAPYSWGATGPNAFDCSGLIFWSYAQVGKSVPRTSSAQIAGGTPVAFSDLQPGDVVGFYPGVTHVGLYIGNGQVVHASTYGTPVQVADISTMPFAGAARY